MTDELDEFMGKLSERLDANYKTALAAAAHREQDRQVLLQNFQAVADGEILPLFRKAAKRSSNAMHIAVEESGGSVGLRVRMTKDGRVAVFGQLRYSADLETRKVMLSEDTENPRRDSKVEVNAGDLNPEKIARAIATFFENLEDSLRQKN